MKFKNFSVILIIFISFKLNQCRKYDKYALYNIKPTKSGQLKFLNDLNNQKYLDVVFWRKPRKLHHRVQAIVGPTDKSLFLERLAQFNLSADNSIIDLQKAFDNQTMQQYIKYRSESFNWKYYHDLDDTYQWLLEIANSYPNISKLESIGKSAEGRDIYAMAIKISNSTRTKIVIIHGGIHGNEWITVEFVTYLIDQLLDIDNSEKRKLRYIAQKYTWYLIPVVNPDGFHFSVKSDRMWRKNRRNTGSGIGVDLDRNFPVSFGTHDSSTNPNNEYYCGPEPLSEPESKALSEFILKHRHRLKFYFAFNAYGQKIVIPYSDKNKHIENYSEMENYAKQAAAKIWRRYGTRYGVGTTYDNFGTRISGYSASWVKKAAKVPIFIMDLDKKYPELIHISYVDKYVYTFYLRDNGTYGHALPSTQIIPSCEEALTGMVHLMTAKLRYVNYRNRASSLKEGVVLMSCIFTALK